MESVLHDLSSPSMARLIGRSRHDIRKVTGRVRRNSYDRRLHPREDRYHSTRDLFCCRIRTNGTGLHVGTDYRRTRIQHRPLVEYMDEEENLLPSSLKKRKILRMEDLPLFLYAPGRIRTCDTRFRKPMLYPLSYGGQNTYVPYYTK